MFFMVFQYFSKSLRRCFPSPKLGPKQLPNASKMLPRASQEPPKCLPRRPRGSKSAPKGSKSVLRRSKRPQGAPKRSPRGSKRPQEPLEAPKRLPRCLRRPPRASKRRLRDPKEHPDVTLDDCSPKGVSGHKSHLLGVGGMSRRLVNLAYEC